MRASSRRRVAAWLLGLPAARGGEECARRGRLEMISFWLLCWKLLRATAGLRRTTAELTDGSQDDSNPGNSNPSSNNPANDSSTPTPPPEPVTMEISSLLPLAETETDVPIGCCSAGGEQLHLPEDNRAITHDLGEEKEKDREGGENLGVKECEEIVGGGPPFKPEGEERGGRDGGILETVVEVGEVEETAGETVKRVVEDGEAIERVLEDEERVERVVEDGEAIERVVEDKETVERVVEDGERVERLVEDGETVKRVVEDGEAIERVVEDKETVERVVEDGEKVEYNGEKLETAEEEEESGVFLTYDTTGPQEVAGSNPSALPVEGWCCDQRGRDDLSDGHLSDGHLSDGHLSDCIQAELAFVTSDSDTGEDQWVASTTGNIADQGEVRDEIQDGGRSGQGLGEQAQGRAAGRWVEEKRGDRGDKASGETPERELLPRSPSLSSSACSTDPDSKFPADFCSPQEASSENVSTEHLDFLLARQQWKKMEEEVKGQPLPQPGVKRQGSFQGTHSSLYPPTRSPRLQRREVHPQTVPREPPLCCTVSPSSEDSGLGDSSYRSPPEDPESAVEREIRLTLEREERHRRERGGASQALLVPRPTGLQSGRSPPRPPACRTPTLSISPSSTPISSSSSSTAPRPAYHEMTANNVIILEPDSSRSAASRSRLLAPGRGGGSSWPTAGPDTAGDVANVVVVETSNLIIRSASEFCMSAGAAAGPPVAAETQESTFSSNPFFKLRSLSSQSLVEREIRVVRQREEEWRRQREEEWRRGKEEDWRKGRVERYDTVLVSTGLSENVSYNASEVPDRCVSSPSSPSRTRKMERSSLSCDHKFPPGLSTLPRRQNAMALRWEASLLANQKKD